MLLPYDDYGHSLNTKTAFRCILKLAPLQGDEQSGVTVRLLTHYSEFGDVSSGEKRFKDVVISTTTGKRHDAAFVTLCKNSGTPSGVLKVRSVCSIYEVSGP